LKWAFFIVELSKAERTEAAVIGREFGTGLAATGAPQATAASAITKPAVARVPL